jgi:hypothetical protein
VGQKFVGIDRDLILLYVAALAATDRFRSLRCRPNTARCGRQAIGRGPTPAMIDKREICHSVSFDQAIYRTLAQLAPIDNYNWQYFY